MFLLLSYRFPSSAVKWIRGSSVTLQCFSKQVKWSSSFIFNEFQSVNNVEIDLRDFKPETFRRNCHKVKQGFAISTNTWDPFSDKKPSLCSTRKRAFWQILPLKKWQLTSFTAQSSTAWLNHLLWSLRMCDMELMQYISYWRRVYAWWVCWKWYGITGQLLFRSETRS